MSKRPIQVKILVVALILHCCLSYDEITDDTDDVPSWDELSEQMMAEFSQFTRPRLTAQQQQWFDSLGSNQYSYQNGTYDIVDGLTYIGAPLCVRKEYRAMSTEERTQYHEAVTAMANSCPDPDDYRSEYLIFVHMHDLDEAPAAHFGSAFLPWHREFLLRYERALQSHNPYVCIPYWDSHLDQLLPEPADSVMWTGQEFGNNDGAVVTGPYSNFTLLHECVQYAADNGTTLARFFVGTEVAKRLLPTDEKLAWISQQEYYANITCIDNPSDCYFENRIHGSVHLSFNPGHMAFVFCSPSDPIFFSHHNYIDLLWEEFRQNHQVTDIEKEYPGGPTFPNITQEHQWYAPMLPLNPNLNGQGLSTYYTSVYYTYTQRPSAVQCTQDLDCGNPDLVWCDITTQKCTSKVRIGGRCTGLEDKACADHCDQSTTPACSLGTCTCV